MKDKHVKSINDSKPTKKEINLLDGQQGNLLKQKGGQRDTPIIYGEYTMGDQRLVQKGRANQKQISPRDTSSLN